MLEHKNLSFLLDDTQLVRQAQKGDTQALALLCKHYEGLVIKLSKAKHLGGEEAEVYSHLWELFILAVQNFDTKSAIPFAGYVKSKLSYGQWNVFKRLRHRWMHETFVAPPSSAVTEEAMLVCFGVSPDSETEYLRQWQWQKERQALHKALLSLPRTDRHFLVVHYGRGLSLSQMAKKMGISRQRAAYHHKKLIARLRCAMMPN